MAAERDFNDVLDDIFVNEEIEHKNSFEEGFKAGKEAGNPEGYHLGYHRGAELGKELGYYLGTITYHINTNESAAAKYSDKILSQLTKVKELIEAFPCTNSEDHDILDMAEKIRAQYKKACALLKHSHSIMDSTMLKIRTHIDSILAYLTPLLPLANCHMVEFLTENHWEKLVPRYLRETLDGMEMEAAVEQFWSSCESNVCDQSQLSQWVHAARSCCLTVNDQYCISVPQFEDRIRAWGGEMQPEIRVKDFMNSKKSYEVSTMSRLLSSLYHATHASCTVEAGGGRGHLLAAAASGHRLRCLTLDCDANTLASAEARGKLIQKQWHAIAKQVENGRVQSVSKPAGERLHRFAQLFITENTDLGAVVQETFPELEQEDLRILLTGLHTCGNLGPSSLRIFTAQPSTCGILNVPCCYHLLTEAVDGTMFDVFQKNYGGEGERSGFPMSEHLRGCNLGRNARMLAAQSIERVASQRQLPARSLLHRALLQELIKKHRPDFVLAEGRLKRVAAKTQDFEQYFKMADSILNLELFDSLPASDTSNVDCQWKKMVLFYLIRLCLAQVIESLILLDRLLFLMENGFNNVFLVKLFDPVLSPRCHSIVAVR